MSLDATLAKAVEDGVIPGAVLLAASDQGELDYAKVLGKQSLMAGRDEPLKLDTVFTIASMTKLLTAICALQLAERGVISLEEDVSEHVPVLARQPVLTGFAEDGSPVLVKRQKMITLRLLLTHSSGTGYTFLDPQLKRYAEYIGKNDLASGTVDELFDLPLLYPPGEGWAYGSGTSWAGKVIEKVTGQSLGSYMEENIFAPLGISRITFFPQDVPALAGSLSDMFIRDEDSGKLVAAGPRLPFFGPLTECLGGEGAYADLQDYMKILLSLLRDDEKLLKRETAALIFQPQIPTEQAKAGIQEAMKDPSWVVGDFSGPKEFDWAYGGLTVVGDAHPFRRRGYICWAGAGNPFWFIDRKAGVCGIFGTQVLPAADNMVESLISAFEKEVYAMVKEAKRQARNA